MDRHGADHQLTVRAAVGDEHVDALASFVKRTRVATAMLVLAGLLVVLAVVLVAMMFRGGQQATAAVIALAPLALDEALGRRL